MKLRPTLIAFAMASVSTQVAAQTIGGTETMRWIYSVPAATERITECTMTIDTSQITLSATKSGTDYILDSGTSRLILDVVSYNAGEITIDIPLQLTNQIDATDQLAVSNRTISVFPTNVTDGPLTLSDHVTVSHMAETGTIVINHLADGDIPPTGDRNYKIEIGGVFVVNEAVYEGDGNANPGATPLATYEIPAVATCFHME